MSDYHLLQTVAIRALKDELCMRFRGGTITVSDQVKELGTIVHADCLSRWPRQIGSTTTSTRPAAFPFPAVSFIR